MSELIKIPIGEKIIVLKQEDFDTDIDIDDVIQIHYENLYGEIVTISALYNRIGILKAQVDNEYEDYKLDCNIFESQTRKNIIARELSLGKKRPSINDLEDEVNTNPDVIAKRKRLNQLKKNCDYITALYWAIQSKDKKLSVLMKGVTPEEFADKIVEGRINYFYIRKFNQKL